MEIDDKMKQYNYSKELTILCNIYHVCMYACMCVNSANKMQLEECFVCYNPDKSKLTIIKLTMHN